MLTNNAEDAVVIPRLASKAARPGRRAAWLLLVAGTWIVAGVVPLLRPGCPFVRVFQHPCPGCGMTRALWLLGHGHVGDSLLLQPLAVPALLVQAGFAAYTLWLTARAGSPLGLLRRRGGRVALALLVLTGLACVVLWLARFGGACGGPVPV